MLQNVRAEDAVRFRVRHKLDHSIDILVTERAAVGAERELADPIIDPLFLRLIFGQADTSQFRIRVDDSGNRVIVHVTSFAGNYLNAGDPFVFGFMR